MFTSIGNILSHRLHSRCYSQKSIKSNFKYKILIDIGIERVNFKLKAIKSEDAAIKRTACQIWLIFEQVHHQLEHADDNENLIRISLNTKAFHIKGSKKPSSKEIDKLFRSTFDLNKSHHLTTIGLFPKGSTENEYIELGFINKDKKLTLEEIECYYKSAEGSYFSGNCLHAARYLQNGLYFAKALENQELIERFTNLMDKIQSNFWCKESDKLTFHTVKE